MIKDGGATRPHWWCIKCQPTKRTKGSTISQRITMIAQQETNQTASRSISPAERETSSRLVIPCDQNTTHDELLRVSFCANKLSKSAPKCLTKKQWRPPHQKQDNLPLFFTFIVVHEFYRWRSRDRIEQEWL